MKRGLVTDNKVPKIYEELVEPHVASFDYFLSDGIQKVVQHVESVEIHHPLANVDVHFTMANPRVGRPIKGGAYAESRIFPRECREMRLTYAAPMEVDICFGGRRITKPLGMLPIMVKSLACHLRGAKKSTLISLGEEANDFGGYFVAGGLEKCLRILISNKRNYIMAISRSSYLNRGPLYTDKAVVMRCVREDEFGTTMRCHYLRDGTVQTCFSLGWMEFFVPAGIILKALKDVSDREIFDQILAGANAKADSNMKTHAAFITERAELLLQQAARYGLQTRNQCIEFLGSHFRPQMEAPQSRSDHDVGLELLSEYVFCHLNSMNDKFNTLIEMIHKLFAFENGICCGDNNDALSTHECLPPGIMFMKCLSDLLNQYMTTLRRLISMDLEKNAEIVDLYDDRYISKILQKCGEPCKKLEMLLKTGNFRSLHSRDLGQSSGFAIIAERINFCRFLSHFRAFHRGSIFVEMKTTKVRKLLPESWGFVCPVHTPDGPPCGLLQHFTADCKVICRGPDNPRTVHDALAMVLTNLGMTPLDATGRRPPIPDYLPVMLDGNVVGHIRSHAAAETVSRMRALKASVLAIAEGTEKLHDIVPLNDIEKMVPSHLEIAYFPYECGGPYPGILLFTSPCRLMRRVLQVGTNSPEMIGPLEQSNLNILCPGGLEDNSSTSEFTHKEVHTRNILSVLAGMTPFSDFNQSPRNMYQCQMLKQTMGTPCQDYAYRPDNKLYRLQTPQTPIARSYRYNQCKMDEYGSGTNAVVAVIAYTGYDMEDAMILNKSSVERGFAHGSVYKTECVCLAEDAVTRTQVFGVDQTPPKKPPKKEKLVGAFGDKFPLNIPSEHDSAAVKKLGVQSARNFSNSAQLDVDGLPHPGAVIWPDKPYYSTVDYSVRKHKLKRLKGQETAVVDSVTVVGRKNNVAGLTSANIKLRIGRNPAIGDKFASRAGQKGILSQKWPDVNMPYCAMTGMRPDLLINPHAFPSRMTIGMLVESLASKGGALEGKFVDCSPFRKSDEGDAYEDPVKVFGEYLEIAGFNRSGTETMICGISGEEMKCDIYIGLVHYQRLRHMVSDKFQCRSTGPINSMTHQPVQGRKAGGGIRFGEMERDSLLAHGASYTIHDRLNLSSDHQVSNICAKCGSLLSTLHKPAILSKEDHRLLELGQTGVEGELGDPYCLFCKSGKDIHRVPVPYVWKLLVSELAAMNIKVTMDVQASAGR